MPTLSANPCYSFEDPKEGSKIIHKSLGRDTIADVVQEAGSAVVTIYVSYPGIACFCSCFLYSRKSDLVVC